MAVDNVYGEPLFSWQLSFNREHARGHIALSRRAAIQPVRVGAVKRESEPFLRLGLCSAAWLGHSMPLPRQAQLQSELAGVGPPLDTILPGQPHLAAVISGYFAARAPRGGSVTRDTRLATCRTPARAGVGADSPRTAALGGESLGRRRWALGHGTNDRRP